MRERGREMGDQFLFNVGTGRNCALPMNLPSPKPSTDTITMLPIIQILSITAGPVLHLYSLVMKNKWGTDLKSSAEISRNLRRSTDICIHKDCNLRQNNLGVAGFHQKRTRTMKIHRRPLLLDIKRTTTTCS